MGALSLREFRKWIGAAAVLSLMIAPLHGADDSLERRIQAAFLLNFTKFVDWPDGAFTDAGSPLTICLFEKDPFGDALDRIVEGETAHNRKVAVQRIKTVPAPRSCQVIFAGAPARDLPQFLARVEPGVLTVGEGEGFLRAGGMIGFVLENRRVRFRINQTLAEKNGLKLSARLLGVAEAVEK